MTSLVSYEDWNEVSAGLDSDSSDISVMASQAPRRRKLPALFDVNEDVVRVNTWMPHTPPTPQIKKIRSNPFAFVDAPILNMVACARCGGSAQVYGCTCMSRCFCASCAISDFIDRHVYAIPCGSCPSPTPWYFTVIPEFDVPQTNDERATHDALKELQELADTLTEPSFALLRARIEYVFHAANGRK